MLRAVAWDIDGTLVDSEPVHLLALQQLCKAHGVDISDLPDEHFIGVHVQDVWKALAPRFAIEFSQAQWVRELNRNYLARALQIKPMPHAASTVAELTRRGIRQVAVSNSNRAIVQANLQVSNFADHMLFSISLDDVAKGKPSPEPYLQATERLGLLAQQILAVEDSLTGLRSARAAGLCTIGYGTSGGALDVHAQYRVSSLRELLDLILPAHEHSF